MTKREILVVDDDAEVRASLSELLEEEGYRVRTASTGREALERCERHGAPDAILLDLQMPAMNGWEVCRALARRAAWARIPVVIISASIDVLPPPSAAAVFNKPVDVNELSTCLQSLLGDDGAKAVDDVRAVAGE